MPDNSTKPISDDCNLLRRINPVHVVADANTGRRRLSSGAFRDRQMSVDAECLLTAGGLDWTQTTKGYASYFLVRFSAGFARQQQQTVNHKPLADNPYHTEVIGRKSDPICNAFRGTATWVVAPSGI
jgi:ribosomal protein L36